jgi:hypothetical protein
MPDARASTATFSVAKNAVSIYDETELRTGNRVRFTTTGVLPAGLVAGTDYYLVRSDAGWVADSMRTTWFKLATSLANAQAIPAVVVTIPDIGTGVHTMTQPTFMNGAEVSIVYNNLRNATGLMFYYSAIANDIQVSMIYGDTNISTGTLTVDPASLAAGATQTYTVTVPGAALGMPAIAVHSRYHVDIEWRATVSAVDTVLVKQKNEGAGAVDLLSGTLRVDVFK